MLFYVVSVVSYNSGEMLTSRDFLSYEAAIDATSLYLPIVRNGYSECGFSEGKFPNYYNIIIKKQDCYHEL